MKALILFDGSKMGYLCLQAACQDAFTANSALVGKSGQPEPVEVILVTGESAFFDGVIANQERVYKNQGELLLDQAKRYCQLKEAKEIQM